MAIGDYLSAARDGVQRRSWSAAVRSLRETREANYNNRELTRRGDLPRPTETRVPQMWVPLSEERQRVPPVQMGSRPEVPAPMRTEPSARKVAAREARPVESEQRTTARTLNYAAALREAGFLAHARDLVEGVVTQRRENQATPQLPKVVTAAAQPTRETTMHKAPQNDRQTRQAATSAFVQGMLDAERKRQRGEGQRELPLKQHVEGQKPKRQMRQ
jgi:hypothetical protein